MTMGTARFFDTLRGITIESLESKGIKADAYRNPPYQRTDDMYAETSGATLAYNWIQRCRISEDEAIGVLSEMGDPPERLMAKVLHLFSNVGPYTDCKKIVDALADEIDGALLLAANNE